MPTYVALLRGINVGGHNRVGMADLRALLEGLGYSDVRTLLQSGNAVFSASTRSPATVETHVQAAITAELGLTVRVLVRTASQLAEVLAADPFGERATDHSRYMVVFLENPLPVAALPGVDPDAYVPEELEVAGSEVYLWLPKGMQDSRLARALTDKRLGGVSTMRNWNTVRKLAEMAGA